MSNKNNSLAELAEWIKRQKDGFPVLANQFKWQDDRDEKNIEKVQRIIEELAKVDNDQYGRPMFMDSKHAIIKCREIAEE